MVFVLWDEKSYKKFLGVLHYYVCLFFFLLVLSIAVMSFFNCYAGSRQLMKYFDILYYTMLVYPNQILQHQTHQKKAHSKQNIFLIWTAPTACLTQNPYKARLWSTSPLFNCNPRSDKRIAGSHKIFIVHLYKQLIFSIKKKKRIGYPGLWK